MLRGDVRLAPQEIPAFAGMEGGAGMEVRAGVEVRAGMEVGVEVEVGVGVEMGKMDGEKFRNFLGKEGAGEGILW